MHLFFPPEDIFRLFKELRHCKNICKIQDQTIAVFSAYIETHHILIVKIHFLPVILLIPVCLLSMYTEKLHTVVPVIHVGSVYIPEIFI